MIVAVIPARGGSKRIRKAFGLCGQANHRMVDQAAQKSGL